MKIYHKNDIDVSDIDAPYVQGKNLSSLYKKRCC
jgi:hypothetical protein